MNKTIKAILILIFVFTGMAHAKLVVSLAWSKTLSGTSRDPICVDSVGDLYLLTRQFVGNDLFQKYDKDGNLLFSKPYTNILYPWVDKQANSVVIDKSDYIYAVGYIDLMIWFGKYDKSGNLLLDKKYSSTYPGYGLKIALDSEGSIYIVGATIKDSNYNDLYLNLIKYDKDGNQKWVNQFGSYQAYSFDWYTQGLMVDKTNTIYYAGGSSSQRFIKKFNKDGGEIGSYPATNLPIRPTGSVMDFNDDICITGSVTGSQGAMYDLYAGKYSKTFTEIWSKTYTYGSGSVSGGTDLTVDSSGNIYILGRISKYDTNQGGCIWLRKYDKDGNVIWTYIYSDDSFYDYEVGRIAIDKAGGIYVTGEIVDSTHTYTQSMIKFVEKDVTVAANLKIVGGKEGYINPNKGETANFVFNTSDVGTVTFKIFSLKGELVRTITAQGNGESQIDSKIYDCKNEEGSVLASGIYVVKAEGPGLNIIKKMAIIK